jgi:hypothetical protein
VKPDELARSVLRLAMEGERDPARLHDGALEQLLPATNWREASWSRVAVPSKAINGEAAHEGWGAAVAANIAKLPELLGKSW